MPSCFGHFCLPSLRLVIGIATAADKMRFYGVKSVGDRPALQFFEINLEISMLYRRSVEKRESELLTLTGSAFDWKKDQCTCTEMLAFASVIN